MTRKNVNEGQKTEDEDEDEDEDEEESNQVKPGQTESNSLLSS